MTAVAATPRWSATDPYDNSVSRFHALTERAEVAYTVEKGMPDLWVSAGSSARADELVSLESVPARSLWVPTGISASAETVERLVHQLAVSNRWLAARSPAWDDIEKEVVVLLPPIRQRTVRLHVHYAGPAEPLIYLGDFLTESDDE